MVRCPADRSPVNCCSPAEIETWLAGIQALDQSPLLHLRRWLNFRAMLRLWREVMTRCLNGRCGDPALICRRFATEVLMALPVSRKGTPWLWAFIFLKKAVMAGSVGGTGARSRSQCRANFLGNPYARFDCRSGQSERIAHIPDLAGRRVAQRQAHAGSQLCWATFGAQWSG